MIDLAYLLERSGCRPRGKRHDCRECKRQRTVTHAEETFFCHGCGWKGNVQVLQRELGLRQRVSPAEYRRQRERRDRAHEAAKRLYRAVRIRRLELRELFFRGCGGWHLLDQMERLERAGAREAFETLKRRVVL